MASFKIMLVCLVLCFVMASGRHHYRNDNPEELGPAQPHKRYDCVCSDGSTGIWKPFGCGSGYAMCASERGNTSCCGPDNIWP
uniref:Sodium ion channel toxin n=1 Tax=Edwardsia elegans TaxID=132404 RepID=A0A4Y5RX14_9CNID|nr:sodium ion channel toxin [Edwardsia elegans]